MGRLDEVNVVVDVDLTLNDDDDDAEAMVIVEKSADGMGEESHGEEEDFPPAPREDKSRWVRAFS